MTSEERCIEIAAGLLKLRPTPFRAQLDSWRRGGIANSAWSEMVTRSRGAPLPALDAIDRELQLANRAYFDSLDDMGRLLATMMGLEHKYLIPTHVATEEEREIAADLGHECQACLRPVVNTPADPVESGFCHSCRVAWDRAGRPDRVEWIVRRRTALEVAQ